MMLAQHQKSPSSDSSELSFEDLGLDPIVPDDQLNGSDRVRSPHMVRRIRLVLCIAPPAYDALKSVKAASGRAGRALGGIGHATVVNRAPERECELPPSFVRDLAVKIRVGFTTEKIHQRNKSTGVTSVGSTCGKSTGEKIHEGSGCG